MSEQFNEQQNFQTDDEDTEGHRLPPPFNGDEDVEAHRMQVQPPRDADNQGNQW